MTSIPDTFVLRGPDLNRAVEAGVLSQESAVSLVDFVNQISASDQDSENLRLVTGFGDIFVTIGLGLFLGALAFLSGSYWFVTVSVAAWILAEIFTRWKRMALPSIALLLIFAGSVFGGLVSVLGDSGDGAQSVASALAPAGLLTVIAVVLHWLRFRVPVTVAAGAAAAMAVVVGLVGMAVPDMTEFQTSFVFLPMGLLVFAAAMYFDMNDLSRRTPRTDIAFWLHLLAAPAIVHPLMLMIGSQEPISISASLGVFAVFTVLSGVALVVDRRALLVSSLTYLGYALSGVISRGSDITTAALPVLIVGAIVLALSLAWRPMRAALLRLLPASITKSVPAANAVYPKSKASA